MYSFMEQVFVYIFMEITMSILIYVEYKRKIIRHFYVIPKVRTNWVENTHILCTHRWIIKQGFMKTRKILVTSVSMIGRNSHRFWLYIHIFIYVHIYTCKCIIKFARNKLFSKLFNLLNFLFLAHLTHPSLRVVSFLWFCCPIYLNGLSLLENLLTAMY